MNRLIPLIFLLTGCGVNVHVDPVESKPVQVVHTLNINFDSVINFCKSKCSTETDPALASACADTCYKNFIDILTHAVQGLVLPPT